jgi:poly(3-hydroxybutyrate) depolymerase
MGQVAASLEVLRVRFFWCADWFVAIDNLQHTTYPPPPPCTRTRAYAHQVPRSYHVLFPTGGVNLTDGNARHPVVIAFHGNGGDAASYAMQTPHLSVEAPKRGFFLVYAEGVQTPGSKLRCQERSWNSGTCCGAAYLNDVDDVGYVRDALEDLFQTFPSADRRRVRAIFRLIFLPATL